MHLYNFFVRGPKFTRFLLSNLGAAVVDQILFRFLMCPHVPEIFAIKVESCQKSRRNLDAFWPSQILRGGPSKNCTHVITRLATRRLEKFHEDIPTSPEIIGVHTLNFKPNFKFSPLEFFLGTPVPLRVCAIKAWSISSVCKIFGAQHPLWAEIYTVSHKKTRHVYFCDNSGKYWPILIILSPSLSQMNCRRRLNKIYHFTSNLLPHYLAKFECSTRLLYSMLFNASVCRIVYFQYQRY